MGYNLIITEKTDEHIDSLAGYLLGKLKNPQAAGNFLNEIEGIYDRLENNPYQFPISSDKYLALKDYREAHFQKMSLWLTQSKYAIHKEVPISQVFQDNVGYEGLFYTGRFDFVVYEKYKNRETPVFAIELDGKEHLEDEVVRRRDIEKNKICREHNLQLIRVENTYARRYNYIKNILMIYFAIKH